MILLIDNYDSFSYNLYQLVGTLNDDIKVIRNDEMTVEEIEKLNLSHIILSPGPGRPENAGVCVEVVKKLSNNAGKPKNSLPLNSSRRLCGHIVHNSVDGLDLVYYPARAYSENFVWYA